MPDIFNISRMIRLGEFDDNWLDDQSSAKYRNKTTRFHDESDVPDALDYKAEQPLNFDS